MPQQRISAAATISHTTFNASSTLKRACFQATQHTRELLEKTKLISDTGRYRAFQRVALALHNALVINLSACILVTVSSSFVLR